ncbi:ABC transporter substrate-binding protein [Antrihabitans sp. YC2-6]|uniref:ABC transporter substrate-binding protein n=1 Tax=Antrihabitans sp. YC2-6 TaxID=2799498 RepID=UPI0018F403C4|nr:ABC transporter substrate-binding protein [Antrihabitans sp. YC2-6]MBJ8344245.1 ABC transporter substrate-binding protein [Antrihabitans sp. YC2-6]
MKPGGPAIVRSIVAVIVLALALATACGSGDENRRVSIGHSLGQSEVNGIPERIVALGTQWLDATEALGITPVGYIDDVAVSTGAPAPWEPPELADSVAIDPRGDILAQVQALDPDLILTPGFAADEKNYGGLSKIAPTVPNLGNTQIDSWTAQVDVLGKILDREGQAASLIANLNGRIDAIAKKYPGLAGKTYAAIRVESPTEFSAITAPEIGANTLFTKLGMKLPPQLTADPQAGRKTFPLERIVDFPTDLLVITATSPEAADALGAVPGYYELPSVQKGSVAVLDIATGTGLELLSPLSLPYALDMLDPTLEVAAT